jgi:hypothetical protein
MKNLMDVRKMFMDENGEYREDGSWKPGSVGAHKAVGIINATIRLSRMAVFHIQHFSNKKTTNPNLAEGLHKCVGSDSEDALKNHHE